MMELHTMRTWLFVFVIVTVMMTGCSPAGKVKSEPNT